ncbi:hypothetical protein Tco_1288851 [Tanacetum coccineum]
MYNVCGEKSPIPIGDGDGDVNRFPDGDGDGDGDGDEAKKRGWGCIRFTVLASISLPERLKAGCLTNSIATNITSPTAVLFDVDTRRISIRHCEILKSITLNVLARLQG